MDLNFILCLLIVADLLWWARADARLRPSRFSRAWRLLLACWVLGQSGYILLWICKAGWTRSRANPVPLPFHVSVYLWHLLVLPWLCVGMGISFIRKYFRRRVRGIRVRGRDESTTAAVVGGVEGGAVLVDTPASSSLSRRQLITAVAVALPPLAAAGVTARAVARLNDFRVREVNLYLPDLPADLHGLTIAQVTDLHIGKFTRDGMVRRVAEATNALAADLVVFTGDLIDLSQDDLQAGIDFIRALKPRHGPSCLAMIEGNHDLLEYAPGFEQKVRDAGLPLLIDEAMTVQIPGRRTPVQWLGLRWGAETSAENSKLDRLTMTDASIAASIRRVLPLRQADAFPILLSHHPHALDPAAAAGLPLILSGHTHGGQLMLTDHIGAGPLRFRYWTGLYRKAASQLFVCNGVGSWFPLRVNAPAEIVKLTLNRV